MRVTYNGPLDEVELAELTQVTVKRGQSIEVSDDLGARLIEQSCWDATPAEVLAWVGKDPERAAVLLRAEQDGAQRDDVVAGLDRIVNPSKKSGGQVSAGKPVVVGEQGPELSTADREGEGN